MTIGRRRACPQRWGRTWRAGAGIVPRLVRLPRDEPTGFSLVRRSFRGELEARLAESARRRPPYFGPRSLPLRFLAVNAIRIRWEGSVTARRSCPDWTFATVWGAGHMALMTRPDVINPLERDLV